MKHTSNFNCSENHSHSAKKAAIHRIKIIAGHVKCLERMIDEDAYCLDIVHQSRAVQKALKNLDIHLIEDHLKTCVIDQVKNGQEEKTTVELLKLYDFK